MVLAITKIVMKLKENDRVLRPLKVTAFNGNGIGRQRHELGKQLQDLHIDVALFLDSPKTS
jgi:hypothetical protein